MLSQQTSDTKSSPPLVFLESARMTKCRRKARWQKTRESYQCMNLITTQMAPRNEEKVDVLETLHNSFCFSHLNLPWPPRRRSVFTAWCHVSLIYDQ